MVPFQIFLSDFHMVIQIAMGWENAHLHQFIKNREYYAPRSPYEDGMDSIDYDERLLSDLLTMEKDKIIYDYGDSWEHQILLEKFFLLTTISNVLYARQGRIIAHLRMSVASGDMEACSKH